MDFYCIENQSRHKNNAQDKKISYLIRLLMFFLGSVLMMCPARIYAQIDTDNVTIMGRNALSMDDYVTAIRYFNQVIDVKPHLYAPYYYRAYAKFSLEDYVGAEADCTQSLNINPYQSEVYQLRGLCRIHNENFQGAIDDYSKSLIEEPDDQGSLYNRALCRLELKDFEIADKDMNLILSKWRTFQRAYLIKAQIAMELKDTTESLVWVDSLLHINPINEQAWSFKGRYALSKENFAEADSFMTKAIDINPNNFENYIIRAQVRHGLNRFDKALADYDRTIELVPEHFVAHYNRGLLRALVGDKNRAIEDFNFVLQTEPDNTLAMYNRALLLEETGNYKGAIKDYTNLIKSYPNFYYGYVARANCRRKIGDIEGAISDETYVTRAQLDMKYKPHKRHPVKEVRKRSDHSLDQYEQLVEETPDTTRRFVNQLIGKIQNRRVEQSPIPMFTIAYRTRDLSKGFRAPAFLPEIARINHKKILSNNLTFEATEERALSIDQIESFLKEVSSKTPTSAETHLVGAILHTALYNYEEALSEIDQAIKMDSLNYIYPLQKATILKAKQKSVTTASAATEKGNDLLPLPTASIRQPQPLQGALGYINQALRLSPNNAYLLYNRGCLYAEMQQKQAALNEFEAALKADPQLAEARYNRALLYIQMGEIDKAIPNLSRAGQDGLYKAYNLLKQATRLKAEGKKDKKSEKSKE